MSDQTSVSGDLDTLNDILLYAPAEYDGDEAIDVIAVRYVRDLEVKVETLQVQRAAALALHQPRQGVCLKCADERIDSRFFPAWPCATASALGAEQDRASTRCSSEHPEMAVDCAREVGHDGRHCNAVSRTGKAFLPFSIDWENTGD